MCKYPLKIVRKLDRKDPLPVVGENGQREYYVPCGRCEECCRRRKNDWYVRCRAEYTFGKYPQILFCSFTFDNDHLPATKEDLSHRIRAFKDRLRKSLGYMPKHILISERGDDTNRIHLHGFLFMLSRELYNDVRDCWIDGFCWIEPMKTLKAIQYSLKYIFKSILQRMEGDKLVGRIYASLHFGECYVTEQTVRYHFRPYDEFGYNRIVTFLDRGKAWSYALPAYLMRKIEEWVGFKKMCTPDDYWRARCDYKPVSAKVRERILEPWRRSMLLYLNEYQTSDFNS